MSDSTFQKKRILFVTHAGNFYGACRSLHDILEGLDRKAFEPHLASPSEGLLLEKARALGIPTYIAPSKTWASIKTSVLNLPLNLSGALKLASIIRKQGIDLVYTNSGGVISGALAAKWTGTPHVWHVREEVSTHKLAFRLIHQLSRRIVANSEFTRNRFEQDQRSSVAVIYNGFHLKDYVFSPAEKPALKQKYGFAPTDTVVSLVGNINERKGQTESAQALPIVLKKHSNVKMVFAGECYSYNKDYQAEVERILEKEGIRQSVVFTGFKEDVSEIYKMTDLLIVPSRYEAFGRVVVEALLYGVPVLGTNVGGIPEIIEHHKTGYLVESRKPGALAAAITEALDDRARMAAIGHEGKISAEQKFRVETTVRAVEKTLWQVLAA